MNRKGSVTTPAVREASRTLKQAKKAARKAAPRVEGPLTRGQKVFARRLARKTPLSPRVIAAQELAEQSGEAAARREAEGNHNWLNIGYFDSGPGQLTADQTWSNPKSAADATARFLEGRQFGASEGIKAILPAAKGKPDREQIAAIARSGWATNPEYQSLIEGTHDLVSAKPGNPKAAKRLKRAQVNAAKLGLRAAQPKGTLGPPPKKVITRFKAARVAAKELEKAKLPYVWGGGHNTGDVDLGSGVDCSGAVSYVLQKMGVKLPGGVVSGEMGSYVKPGPGAVTVFYNPTHTFMRIGNEYFGTSASNPGGGAGFIPTSVAEPEALSGSYSVGHIPGLGKKVALQLGVSASAGGVPSFPGMTLSSSGTTATIDQGAGATQSKPGFSKVPIKLTRQQKYRRATRKLREAGVGGDTQEPEVSETIKALEEKYGARAA